MLKEFRNTTRGYLLRLETDLLGDIIVERRWFGLNNQRHGGKRQVFTPNEEKKALKIVSKTCKSRLFHGYQQIREVL